MKVDGDSGCGRLKSGGMVDTPPLLLQKQFLFPHIILIFSQPKKMNEMETKFSSSRLNDTFKLKIQKIIMFVYLEPDKPLFKV